MKKTLLFIICVFGISGSYAQPESCFGGQFALSGTSTSLTCFGDCNATITISATGGTGTYTYDIGSGTQASNVFTNLCANSYTINVDDGASCNGDVNITITEPVQISISSSVTGQVSGNDGAIDITVTGGTPVYAYAWTGPNSFTSTNEDITGLEVGTYTVTVTDTNGCTTNVDIDVFAVSSVGENELKFTMYPNPADNQLTISLMQNDQVNLVLFDNSGRVVQRQSLLSENNTIDISSLATGLYTINLTSSEGYVSTKKLMIK